MGGVLIYSMYYAPAAVNLTGSMVDDCIVSVLVRTRTAYRTSVCQYRNIYTGKGDSQAETVKLMNLHEVA